MDRSAPSITIGLPVCNGENYVAEAIDSVLAQTWTDFELLIRDNASTDRTPEIIRDYARRDPRIVVHGDGANCGAAGNFNRVLALARAPYFKWMAHDDRLEPTCLERCMEVLRARPDVILCHCLTVTIDAEGNSLGVRPNLLLRTGDDSPIERFAQMVLIRHACSEVFGLMRTEVLRRADPIGGYTAADRVLLAELALRGKLAIVPEPLFHNREHPMRSVRIPLHLRKDWFRGEAHQSNEFPSWKLLSRYHRALWRFRMPLRRKLRGEWILVRWFCLQWRNLGGELKALLRSRLPGRPTGAS